MIVIGSPPPLGRRRIKRMSGAPILTAEQMRNAEQHLYASGVPAYDVMERAGAAAANIIWRVGASRDALILCGPGNNGYRKRGGKGKRVMVRLGFGGGGIIKK